MEPLSPLRLPTYPDSGKLSPYRGSTACSSSGFALAPQVSASAWSLVNLDTGECLWGKNQNSIRDIASLTKMMTFYVVKQCIRQRLITDQDLVVTPKEAILLGGTSAYLRPNDTLKVTDLLYGMMLPSGNDAAYTLADYCGGKMIKDIRLNRKKLTCSNVDFFVKQMNVFCKHIGLKNTLFLNPHGLSHLGNHSTAAEIGKLASLLINKPIVMQVVSAVKYSCEVKNGQNLRRLTWVNTNLMLGVPGITGLKTGHTPTAGPCVCITYVSNGFRLAVTLLKSRTADKRWPEAHKLLEWATGQLEVILAKHPDRTMKTKNLGNLINSLE